MLNSPGAVWFNGAGRGRPNYLVPLEPVGMGPNSGITSVCLMIHLMSCVVPKSTGLTGTILIEN